MFELVNNRNPQLPAWVKVEEAIPGYSGMEIQDQMHYEDLYVLACHPEMLQQLPEDVRDLHALMYFIFQYNLSHRWIAGDLIHIVPFIPVKWTHESGLRMEMTSGLYAPLLENISELQTSRSLYFSISMLSLSLMRRVEPEAKNYHLVITLLAAILDGEYSETLLSALKEQRSNLKEPWLINYLPSPANVIINPADKNAQKIRRDLLGDGISQGMFPPAREPQETQEEAQIEQNSLYSRIISRCLIS